MILEHEVFSLSIHDTEEIAKKLTMYTQKDLDAIGVESPFPQCNAVEITEDNCIDFGLNLSKLRADAIEFFRSKLHFLSREVMIPMGAACAGGGIGGCAKVKEAGKTFRLGPGSLFLCPDHSLAWSKNKLENYEPRSKIPIGATCAGGRIGGCSKVKEVGDKFTIGPGTLFLCYDHSLAWSNNKLENYEPRPIIPIGAICAGGGTGGCTKVKEVGDYFYRGPGSLFLCVDHNGAWTRNTLENYQPKIKSFPLSIKPVETSGFSTAVPIGATCAGGGIEGCIKVKEVGDKFTIGPGSLFFCIDHNGAWSRNTLENYKPMAKSFSSTFKPVKNPDFPIPMSATCAGGGIGGCIKVKEVGDNFCRGPGALFFCIDHNGAWSKNTLENYKPRPKRRRK